MRKEKQLLLDVQRQAALEKEVYLPTLSLLFVPHHLFSCPVQGPGVLRLCWPLSCNPVDLTCKPRAVGGSARRPGTYRPQILETVASVALASNSCFVVFHLPHF